MTPWISPEMHSALSLVGLCLWFSVVCLLIYVASSMMWSGTSPTLARFRLQRKRAGVWISSSAIAASDFLLTVGMIPVLLILVVYVQLHNRKA